MSMTVPTSIVLPVALLIKMLGEMMVYLKMSLFVPIEMLNGFVKLN